MDSVKCPYCTDRLDLDTDKAIEHLAEHLRIMREASAEVEVDPQEGCEHLSPWRREDFSRNRTHELRGDEGAESADEMRQPRQDEGSHWAGE